MPILKNWVGIIVFRRIRDSVAQFRANIPVTALSLVFVCGPVYSLTWSFDLIDTLTARVSLTFLVSILPIALAFTNFDDNVSLWRKFGDTPWLVVFLFLANALAVSDRFNWIAAGSHVVALIVALFWCWVIWKLVGRNWLIWTALSVGIAETMIYWVAALVKANEPDTWQLFLLPLFAVLFLGAIWAPIASLIIGIARRRKFRRIAGPGLQALAMAVLFLPAVLIAITVPPGLQLQQEWSAVSLLFAGILLSALIGEPLRRFLLEWAGLQVNRP